MAEYRCTAATFVRSQTDQGPAPKVRLGLVDIETGETFCAFFNVSVKRERNTRAGQVGESFNDLKQFIPRLGGELMRVWDEAELASRHKSRTDIWECVGRFIGLQFFGPAPNDKGVISAREIHPLTSAPGSPEKHRLRSKNKHRLSTGYLPVKDRLSTGYQGPFLPVKETLEPAKSLGLQPISTRAPSGDKQQQTNNEQHLNRKDSKDAGNGNSANNENSASPKKRRTRGERTRKTPWPEWFLRQRLHPAQPNRDDLKFLRRYLPPDPSSIQAWGILTAYRCEWMDAVNADEKHRQDAGRFRANSWLREKFGEPLS